MINFSSYYINLDIESERREHMETQASRLGLEFIRFSAIDKNHISIDKIRNYKPHGPGRTRWEMRKLEIAVFESHRRVWQLVANDSFAYALIMEDDIIFSDDFVFYLKLIRDSKVDFDIIRLNTCPQIRHFGPKILLNSDYCLREILQDMADAGAYLVSRHACRPLIEMSENYCDHLDDFLFSPSRKLKTYQFLPAIAGQAIHESDAIKSTYRSTISDSARFTEDNGYNKTAKGPFYYRLKKEIRRFKLKCILYWKHGFGRSIYIKADWPR